MNLVNNNSDGIGIVGQRNATQTLGNDKLRDDFLRLLVTQMRHQDPLNPLSGADFTAQLAQFSSLEQMQNISGKLDESVEADMIMARSINNTMAATLIGKEVRAVDNQLKYTGGGDITAGFILGERAGRVTVDVLNADGVVVRTITQANVSKGDGSVVWDGRDMRGSRMPAGDYSFTVSAVGADGTSDVEVNPLAVGRVTGVRFVGGNPMLMVGGREIQFGAVLEIGETTQAENNGGGGAGIAGFLSKLLQEGN